MYKKKNIANWEAHCWIVHTLRLFFMSCPSLYGGLRAPSKGLSSITSYSAAQQTVWVLSLWCHPHRSGMFCAILAHTNNLLRSLHALKEILHGEALKFEVSCAFLSLLRAPLFPGPNVLASQGLALLFLEPFPRCAWPLVKKGWWGI